MKIKTIIRRTFYVITVISVLFLLYSFFPIDNTESEIRLDHNDPNDYSIPPIKDFEQFIEGSQDND